MTWPIGPNLAPGWIAATIKEEGQTCGCDSSLLNKSVFSSNSVNPTVPLRFEFAQCLVLDFGDAWVVKRGLGLSDEVTLTVP
ncbi:hypothetical protein O181_121161, partial [Austropuccinia psidii MF-1]|nr:hypothetical protein [Austropuccinia psidii MF-1]